MKRILLIDDNLDILRFIELILRSEGFEIATARDGREALQQFTTFRPDAVVCDVNLPHFDGWTICRHIKAERPVPVMLLTVRAEQHDLEQSRLAGADDHMLKPFDIELFLQRLHQLVSPTHLIA